MNKYAIVTIIQCVLLSFSSTVFSDAQYRDHVVIVGSSTVFPIVSTVAERYSRSSKKPSPVVISMGTGGGFKLFCSNKGVDTPDIAMASREIKQTELDQCSSNGISDIIKVKIGYDGIVFASSKTSKQYNLSMLDLYRALAREVPDPSGEPTLITNPYQRWNQIDPLLPDIPIRLLGPPPTSGTRDILIEQLVDPSCQKFEFLRELFHENIEEYRKHCHTFREDGAYVNAGENDGRIVRKLTNDPGAIGIIGYNFVDRNVDKLKAASINNITPEFELIESGVYPLSRPLYLYINKVHIKHINGLYDFLLEFTSESSWSEDGYLADKGLIPLSTKTRPYWRCQVTSSQQSKPGNCQP
jgi:phosphate transport system substrate-binding protein